MSRRHAALLLLLGLAGCGSSAVPAKDVAAARATATTTPMTTTAKPVAATIKDFAFKPRTLHVARGTRVTWTNRDDTNHTVTFKKVPGDLGNLNEGRHRSATFAKAGTYTYVCQYHPSMHGTVIVK